MEAAVGTGTCSCSGLVAGDKVAPTSFLGQSARILAYDGKIRGTAVVLTHRSRSRPLRLEAKKEEKEKGEGGSGKAGKRRKTSNGVALLPIDNRLGEKEKGKKKSSNGRHGSTNGSAAGGELTFAGVQARAHYPDSIEAHEGAKLKNGKKKGFNYEDELEKLQLELVKLQEWIKDKGLRVIVIFEGRDAAGKGGIIKTITEPLNPRIVSVKALSTPSDRERTQWYFQRYVAHLPSAGEMAVFDRSWYNRAGVEKVMGFCTHEEYKEFMRSCPEFERMLVRSGIILLKYWISVSPEEQEKRFRERLARPEKRWKLSKMDLFSRARWSDYSHAKDVMFSYCDIKQAPWYVVPSDDKKSARLNVISHILSSIPYEDLIVPNDVELPPLQKDHYVRPPISEQTFVPQLFH